MSAAGGGLAWAAQIVAMFERGMERAPIVRSPSLAERTALVSAWLQRYGFQDRNGRPLDRDGRRTAPRRGRACSR